MIVRFDALNRYETPIITLCNPGSIYNDGALTKAVGVLTNTSAEELVANFNSLSEFNLRITQSRYDNAEDDEHIKYMFESVQNRRMIFVGEIGYFLISDIQNGYDANGICYKDIKAVSCEAEIENRMLPYIPDKTYKFVELLELIVETLPLWYIGHIDSSISNKFRTFEDIGEDTNCLSFMLDNMQDAYECIFVFDIIHRTINVYAQDNYVRRTNIHLTKRDLIESMNISENSSDVYTAISVFGDEDLSISAINPLGTTVIYNFNHYLDWMGDTLKTKVVQWQNDINTAKQDYYDLNLQYYQTLDKCSNLDSELKRLNTQITMYQRCRDNIIAESNTTLVDEYNTVILSNGGKEVSILDNINDTITQINELIQECESDKSKISKELNVANENKTSLESKIDTIHKQLKFDTYFTTQESEELCNFIYEGSYRDEYITVTDIMTYAEKFEQMKVLYDRAEKRLETVSRPTQEFNVDVENFIFDKNFITWSEQLETGCLVNIELTENDVAWLFLSNITVNYDDGKMSMTFGNRFNKFDPKSLFDNILGNIDKSANSIDFIKEILYPIKNEFNRMQEILQTSRDLTMNAALTSINEEVVIDGSGYTGRKLLSDGTYDPCQVKLTSNSLVFTNDAWESCSVALGKLIIDNNHTAYGLNADVLMGRVLVGTNLTIEAVNSNNNVTTKIDGDGITVYNGNIRIIDTKNGEIFGTDSNGNLYIKGVIFASGGNIGGWEITDSSLILRNSDDTPRMFISGTGAQIKNYVVGSHTGKDWVIWGNGQFGVTNRGELYASGADITGKITATSLTLGNNASVPSSKVTGLSAVATSGKYSDLTGRPTIPTSVSQLGLDTNTIIFKGDITQSTKTDSNGISYLETVVPTSGGKTIKYSTYNAGDYVVFGRSKGTNSDGNNYICISTQGLLTARNALIYGTVYATDGEFAGKITAESGRIGGWNIASNGLQYKPSNTLKMFISGTGTQNNEYTVGSHTGKDWSIWARHFGITNSGKLYADSAEISGKITATDGEIAGWNIGSKILSKTVTLEDGTTRTTGFQTPDNGAWAITVNASAFGDWSTGTFRVSHSGKMYATDAEVRGKITATSGTIGGCSINSAGKLQVSSANITSLDASRLKVGNSSIKFETYNNDTAMRIYSEDGETYFVVGDDCIILSYADTSANKGSAISLNSTGAWLSSFSGLLMGTWSSNGEISIVSDENKKNSIELLDDRYDVLFDNLTPRRFRYNHGTSGRFHTGFISQEVGKALLFANIDTSEFSGYVVKHNDKDNTDDYYLRYENFISLNTWQIQKCKTRITELENKIVELEEKLTALSN